MLSSNILRIIAAATMLIDHSAHILVDPASPFYLPMRIIGRLAFPIFCFLIVEGFEHTRSLENYYKRLAAFAFISEIPFDLAIGGKFFDLSRQNVYFTLIGGLIAITCAKFVSPRIMELCRAGAEARENRFNQLLVISPIIALICWLCTGFATDYSSYGVLMICAFYLARSCRPAAIALLAVLTVGKVTNITFSQTAPHMLAQFSGYILTPEYNPQLFACAAAIPLALYSGKPGRRMPKYAFYAFYPAHLLVLFIVSLIIP